jgi:non-canonical poly(A) RNA polymerase PAPD5/7
MIEKILERYPFIRPIIIFLKAFLKQRSLNDASIGGMSSYLLFCLFWAFLQYKNKQNNSFSLNPDKINYGALTIDFFQYYGYIFNDQDLWISLKKGGDTFKKRESQYFKNNFFISVENIFDDRKDVGKSCTKWLEIKEQFKYAFQCLKQYNGEGSYLEPLMCPQIIYR